MKKVLAVRHSVLFGFWTKLAAHLGRSPFHLRFASCASQSLLRLEPSLDIRVQAFAAPIPLLTPLRWMVQGCPSLDNPFGGVKVHWTFTTFRLTHRHHYASAGDRPTCFASLPQESESW